MSNVMDEEIKRWAVRRKSSLVLDIVQDKTTVAEADAEDARIADWFARPWPMATGRWPVLPALA